MPVNDAWTNATFQAGANLITHVSAHSADPGAAGTSNAIAVARVVPTKSVDADGDITITAAFTGLPANQAVWGLGYWSAAGTGVPATGGTYYGSGARTTGDATANAAGAITITITITSTVGADT